MRAKPLSYLSHRGRLSPFLSTLNLFLRAWNVLLDLSGFLTILAERPFVTFQPKVMTWWYMTVILGVERKRQVKPNEFKASLGYETLTPSNEARLLLPIYYCVFFSS